MASGKRLAEEGQGSGTLVQDEAKPRPRGVAVHHEVLGVVGNLYDRRHGQRCLERSERRRGVGGPRKTLLAQQLRQGRRDSTEVLDEAPIVAGEAEEAP